MAESADAEASKASVLSGVRVRVPLRAPLLAWRGNVILTAAALSEPDGWPPPAFEIESAKE